MRLTYATIGLRPSSQQSQCHLAFIVVTIPVRIQLTSVMKLILNDLPISQLGQADAAKKPNILWIVGENFFLDLAYYG